MTTICVNASKSYNVYVGSGLLCYVGDYLRNVMPPAAVAIISDSNVWPLYGALVSESLKQSGYAVHSFDFPAGEISKNGQTYLSILEFLAEHHFTRADAIIALGGGVVGDMAGFAAATYLRGIRFIQIPTTLLAMVDSSVGGKTAIDLLAGKNLAGAFYQPDCVLCDLGVLDSLPTETFRDGCAEVIKYGVLYDAQLFAHLRRHGMGFDREYVVTTCIKWKEKVVAEDEFDTGARQKLNLGHTIGHAIEARSHYTIPHGQAVAIGLSVIAKAASYFHICDPSAASDITQTITLFGLPVATAYTASELYANALSDKKRSGEKINLIIPEKIGQCMIRPVSVEQMLPFIEAGI